MRQLIGFISLFLMPMVAGAQLHINNPIDPSDTELANAVRFLADYFGEFGFDRHFLPDFSKYWPAGDCQAYLIPDQMVNAINTSIPTYLLGKPTILSARPEGDNVHVKTLFSRIDSTGNLVVFSITNHYIRHDQSGRLTFVNPMKLANPAWQSSNVRNIIYYYPSYHHFDKRKARELAGRVERLEAEWHLEPIGIRYYFADTKEEIEHYRGFDFTIAMGNRDKPSGMSDGTDNIIYCAGWGENYFHEVVHLYLNKFYPHSPLIEGLAVFYGGSLGHDLMWHIKRISKYLDQHPEIDLNAPEEFYYMDNFTNPLSTLHGLLCDDAYQKDGVAGLRRMMSYTSLDTLFSQEYHLQKGGWDTFLRKMLRDRAQ